MREKPKIDINTLKEGENFHPWDVGLRNYTFYLFKSKSLTRFQQTILIALAWHDGKNQECFVSQKTIAEELRASEEGVRQAINLIIKKEYLRLKDDFENEVERKLRNGKGRRHKLSYVFLYKNHDDKENPKTEEYRTEPKTLRPRNKNPKAEELKTLRPRSKNPKAKRLKPLDQGPENADLKQNFATISTTSGDEGTSERELKNYKEDIKERGKTQENSPLSTSSASGENQNHAEEKNNEQPKEQTLMEKGGEEFNLQHDKAYLIAKLLRVRLQELKEKLEEKLEDKDKRIQLEPGNVDDWASILRNSPEFNKHKGIWWLECIEYIKSQAGRWWLMHHVHGPKRLLMHAEPDDIAKQGIREQLDGNANWHKLHDKPNIIETIKKEDWYDEWENSLHGDDDEDEGDRTKRLLKILDGEEESQQSQEDEEKKVIPGITFTKDKEAQEAQEEDESNVEKPQEKVLEAQQTIVEGLKPEGPKPEAKVYTTDQLDEYINEYDPAIDVW